MRRPSVDYAPIAFFRDAVTRVAIDPDARLAAAVSGADVAVWSIAAADLSNAAVTRLERSAHRSRGGGGRELDRPPGREGPVRVLRRRPRGIRFVRRRSRVRRHGV